MTTGRMVTVEPGRLELQLGSDPVAVSGEAVIAVQAVGICGSDLHLFAGDHPYARFPNVQGHEFAGRIVALPDDDGGRWRIGDRVAIEPLMTCGVCLPCRRGRRNCCTRMETLGVHRDGGLAERIAVPLALLHAIGDLSAELGALVEPVSIGLHAVSRGAPTGGDRAVILGAGPIGLAILLALRDRDVDTLVVDKLANRLMVAS